MNTEFEQTWNDLLLRASKHFKVSADVEFLLFITGVQELGQGIRSFSRSEKMDLINLGRCHIFCLAGYLEETGKDEEGWPLFKTIKPMDSMLPAYQHQLIKKGLIQYFNIHEIN
ncbi:hypothetical protein DMA11_09460 [Marinilabiliaceae bacterium JC017]|nr:hypothetical protein DMA11_09460 [Marinilabiliaceae bacterium JC017]